MTKRQYFPFLFSLLLLVSASMVDNDAINRIVSQLIKFTEENYHEKVYLHTDCDVYNSGEIIWMNARLLEAVSHKQSRKSKVVHVQLFDQTSKLLFHKKLLVQNGAASGDILLPDTLAGGGYLLRAYTAWMQNFSEEFFFEKEIYIANGSSSEKRIVEKPRGVTVNFYPEGGRLVRSMENQVAFKVIANDGKGIDAKGYLVNDKSDTLKAVDTYRNGLGSFLFSPKKGRKYHLALFHKGDTSQYMIPQPEEEGVNLIANVNSEEDILVSIQSSRKFIGENSRLLVLLHARGKVQFAAAAGVFSKYDMSISRSKLVDGINHLTVFDASGKPLLERLLFKSPDEYSSVTVSGLSTSYNRKDLVEVQVSSKLEEDAFLTISVHDRNPINDHNITNYLLLRSDLKGYIEDPGFFFQPSDSATKAADLLMLTHGWTKYTWDQVLNYQEIDVAYPAESDGQIVRGKLINRASGKALEDTMMILSSYNHQPNFIFLRPRENGEFICALPELYGEGTLSVNPAVQGNPKGYTLELVDPFQGDYQYIPNLVPNHSSSLNHEVENRVRENYRLYDPATYSPPQKQLKRDTFTRNQMMGEVKFELYPSDYVQLNDVSELVFELLPSVRLKKRKGEDAFYVLNESVATSYTENIAYEYEVYEQNKEPATVFINGIATMDHSTALNLQYDEIHKVEVYNQKDFPAIDQKFHGAISFTTKEFLKGDQSVAMLEPNEVKFEGYALKREFYVPSKSEIALRDQRKPDLRHLLYWAPNSVLKKGGTSSLNYQTSLVEGEFYLKIEGITESGTPISEVKKFVVNR